MSLHTLIHQIPTTPSCSQLSMIKIFRGIIIDTGAARGNTSSMRHYLAYCYHVGCKSDIDQRKAATCQFGNGSERSQGVALISFPLRALTITFYTHILQGCCVPLLICIDEMDHWGPYFKAPCASSHTSKA